MDDRARPMGAAVVGAVGTGPDDGGDPRAPVPPDRAATAFLRDRALPSFAGLAGDLVSVSDALLDAGDRNGWAVRGLALAALAARAADDGGGGDAEPGADASPADPDADGGAEPGPDRPVRSLRDAGGGVPLAGPDGNDPAADADLFGSGARGAVRVERRTVGGVTVARPVAEPADDEPDIDYPDDRAG